MKRFFEEKAIKKVLLSISLLILVALTFSACGNKEEPEKFESSEEETESEENTENSESEAATPTT